MFFCLYVDLYGLYFGTTVFHTKFRPNFSRISLPFRGGLYLGLSDQTANERLTVWKVYWINGTLTASDILAKAYGAIYRLLGQGDDSAVVILYTSKGTGEEGQARLQSFVQANAASILALLERTKQNQ
jgi:hypothetical protein